MRFEGLRAVLFDLDGTLVHTRIDFAHMKRVVLDLVAARGLDPDDYAPLDVLGILAAAAGRLGDPASFLREAEAAVPAR